MRIACGHDARYLQKKDTGEVVCLQCQIAALESSLSESIRKQERQESRLEAMRRMIPTISGLATFIAGIAPWISPLPTAFLVAVASIEHLQWPVWIAIVAAGILETLGLSVTVTALELRSYNKRRRKTDPTAPDWLAYILTGFYFFSALILTIFMDIFPSLVVYAPGIYPILFLVGFLNLAMRQDHDSRLADIAHLDAERKESRALAKAERQAKKAAKNE